MSKKNNTNGKSAKGTVGKVITTILNVFLTLLLVIFITGIIVACTFAFYVNKYLDPEIDEALLNVGESLTSKIYYYDYVARTFGNRISSSVGNRR